MCTASGTVIFTFSNFRTNAFVFILVTLSRKKLTDHWRRFIHPLKWRCKWLELRINELNSQAGKYDRKLAECNQKKKLNFYGPESQDFNAKSLPFPGQLSREKVMIRRKRKRVEETRDVASYMSQHNLFSYFGTAFKAFATFVLVK